MASSRLAKLLTQSLSISPDAARKRISRLKSPVLRFPIRILPRGESFLYLKDQRTSESFWNLLHAALRETNSVYGFAIDAILARGGAVPENEFSIVSGAPEAMKKQVPSIAVLESLLRAGVLEHTSDKILGSCISIRPYAIGSPDFNEVRTRRLVEGVVLDAIREWIRKLGIGSFNSVAVRGDERERKVGPFGWDLTAPSYLQPLKRSNGYPGFVVADVFVGDFLNEFQVRYFVRKAQLVRTIPAPVLPILVSDGYDASATRYGKSNGVLMATPENLFGSKVGKSLKELTQTLRNAGAVAATDPKKLANLCNDLMAIEGTAGNLRGILFELIAAYLARNQASSIDVGVPARDPKTGRTSDIDVLQVRSRNHSVCIECKGKAPGSILTLDEVEGWLDRVPIFRNHLRSEQRFRDSELSFELWTSAHFSEDALKKLMEESSNRTRTKIAWRDGSSVSELARNTKEKSIRLALDSHFLNHPLS